MIKFITQSEIVFVTELFLLRNFAIFINDPVIYRDMLTGTVIVASSFIICLTRGN